MAAAVALRRASSRVRSGDRAHGIRRSVRASGARRLPPVDRRPNGLPRRRNCFAGLSVRASGEACGPSGRHGTWLGTLDRTFATTYLHAAATAAHSATRSTDAVRRPTSTALDRALSGLDRQSPGPSKVGRLMHGFDFATPLALLLLPLPFLVALMATRGGHERPSVCASRTPCASASAATSPCAGRCHAPSWRDGRRGRSSWWRSPGRARWPRRRRCPATGRDIELVLDLSGSMIAQDMLDAGKPISRIALLKKDGTN